MNKQLVLIELRGFVNVMTKITVYPDTMSDWGHHLLGELSEPYMEAGRRKPPPFSVQGLVDLDGALQLCRVEIDLFNWKYVVSGVGESNLAMPHHDPSLLRRAIEAGELLMEIALLGASGESARSFFQLGREITC